MTDAEQAEKTVREQLESYWEKVECDEDVLYGTRIDIHNGLFPDVETGKRTFYASSQHKALQAAKAYTDEHKRKREELEEEIMLQRSMIILLRSEPGDLTAPVYGRTLARLRQALKDLTKGMVKA